MRIAFFACLLLLAFAAKSALANGSTGIAQSFTEGDAQNPSAMRIDIEGEPAKQLFEYLALHFTPDAPIDYVKKHLWLQLVASNEVYCLHVINSSGTLPIHTYRCNFNFNRTGHIQLQLPAFIGVGN